MTTGRIATASTALADLVARLADRDRARSEATVQADVRQLLLSGDLGLAEHDLLVELETQVGDRRRIDVEVGFTVIEVKKDLRSPTLRRDAEGQLAGYVTTRETQAGQRYVGVLTDGADWYAYHRRDGELVEAAHHAVRAGRPEVDELLVWLEGVLATRQGVRPSPAEIVRRLGATSPSHALDRATLTALYAEHGALPTVALKRELWAKLLRTALGTQFTDDDTLFLEHTLLVNSAEIIAHSLLGFDVATLAPATLLSGQRFDLAGIYGVVQPDFFDWVLEVPGGAAFIRTLARRLGRFDWAAVDHDVLKVLYESVIGADTRKRLGEYYTPDWLAEQVITTAVTTPLTQRILDPACGSGTFLFHAVRRYLDAAEDAGLPLAQALSGVTRHVLGLDLHPVAVALARVTYLLAIGRDRLIDPERGPITVPVYLGDSVQWQQQLDLLTGGHVVIPTTAGDGQLFSYADELRFPDPLLADAAGFDQLVGALTALAAKPAAQRTVASVDATLHRLAVPAQHHAVLRDTFTVLTRLHEQGRDHIWAYYIRNLVRPVWLSRLENRVDVLAGNPPWLSYRHMPPPMQAGFREMSRSRGLWHGAEVATHQDLSGLFVTRAVQQYLAPGGTFAFVMPNAVLDRGYYAGFRAGRYLDPTEPTEVAFDTSWDLRRLRPHFFPRGAAVVFGRRAAAGASIPLANTTSRWTGRLPRGLHSWTQVAGHLTRQPAELVPNEVDQPGSLYQPRFGQGATIVPRMLFMVTAQDVGPLGLAAGGRAVRSARSASEKLPWKNLDAQAGVVEAEFVRPVLLGENVLPHRLLPAREAVLPLDGQQLLSGQHPRLDLYPGLANWWRDAERIWTTHRSSERLSLLEQLDYRRKLTAQLPPPPLRLVYGKAGMHVAAAIVQNPAALIDHTLYWGAVTTEDEGHYLCAVLNSPALTDLVRPLMSYGKDERHVDKALWRLPIPLYDENISEHHQLAQLGRTCTAEIAALPLDETANFVTLRRRVRQALAASTVANEANELVIDLLST